MVLEITPLAQGLSLGVSVFDRIALNPRSGFRCVSPSVLVLCSRCFGL